MGKSQRLREVEVRGVFRLLSDLREMRHDRPAMHQHLAETLCELVGATGGFAADVVGWQPTSAGKNSRSKLGVRSFTGTRQGFDVVRQVMGGLATNNNLLDDPTFAVGVKYQNPVESLSCRRIMSDTPISDFPVFAQVTHESKYVDHLIGWFQKQINADGTPTGDTFGVSMQRYGKGGKLFAGREESLVKLVFEELRWLYTTGRLDPPPGAVAAEILPPRLKQVLDGLMRGKAPKQIALELNLSTLTVRDHIRRLYRRMKVNGRDELMTHFTSRNSPVLIDRVNGHDR